MENRRYKILLVEDNKLDQMAFKRFMEDENIPYDYTIVDSVSEARNILDSERFDVVIVDYLLGDGTAFDILNLVKNTPKVLVTGAGDEEIAVKAWKAGAYDYLIKDQEQNHLKTLPITIENAIEYTRMEAKLRLLSHAVVSTEDSVYITDLQGKITFVNRAFCETYGYEEEEVIGKNCDILWQKSPQDAENVWHAMSGWEVGFFNRRKDGSEFPVSLSRSNVEDEDGNEVACVVIARDISEHMQIENELRTLNKQLEEQNQLTKDLTKALCQRLMTVMAELKSIISNSVASGLGGDGSKLHDNLELADRNTNRVKEIISDFLEISQIDANKLGMELDELSLRFVVSQILKALSPLSAETNVELESSMPDSEVDIHPDWSRIVQVLTELVSKAAKTAPADSRIGT